MNQMEQKLLIVTNFQQNPPQFPKIRTRISCDLTIQELLEQIIKTYRVEVNEKIFSDQNKQLFQLTYQLEKLENADLISDCLGKQGSYEISLHLPNNSRNPKTQERIKQLAVDISEIKNLTSIAQIDQSCRKNIKVHFQPDNENWKPIKIMFECLGGEVTFQDLKSKILDTYYQQYPLYNYFQKKHIFALKIQDIIYRDDYAQKIVYDQYPNQDNLEIQLEFQFPLWDGISDFCLGCAETSKAMIQSGIKFCQVLFQIEDSLKTVSQVDREMIVDNLIEQSIIEYDEQVQFKYTDHIRKYYKAIVDYQTYVKQQRFYTTIACFGVVTLRKAKILNNAIKLSKRLPQEFIFYDSNLSSSKFIKGASYAFGVINLISDVRCLFINSGVGSSIAAYIGSTEIVGSIAVSLISKFPCLSLLSFGVLPLLVGILSGVGACHFMTYASEALLDLLFPPNKNEFNNSQVCLAEISQDQFYENSLKLIGCNHLTSDQDIKKIKIKKLKELHPDQAKEKYNKEKFLEILVAFQAIKEYRRNLALKQK